MSKDEKMAKAVEDYNTFLILDDKKDKSAAYALLKTINLSLVKKHYKDEFKVNPKQGATFNLVSAMAEILEVKADYESGSN